MRQHSINFLPWKGNIFIFFSLGQLPFGTKLIVKLQSTCLVKLIFQHVLNVRKTNRIANFHGLELRHREHIKELVALEIGSNSFETFEKQGPGACLSKVPKLFGPLSGATIAFISSQRRGSKPSNFVFLVLKTCKKISFSKQADCSLTTSLSGPKSSRDFRETDPWGTNKLLRRYTYKNQVRHSSYS